MPRILVFGMFFFSAHLAHAALGGDAASIEAGLKKMHLQQHTVSSQGKYTVHEIAPKKFKLHEFMSLNGKVFAIAWCGKSRPDLDAVLGEHVQDFKAAIEKARTGPHARRGAIVDFQDFHLELSGHGMYSCGRAWLTSQIPQGVTTDALH